MKFIPNYRVCYGGRFYEAGNPFSIKAEDADMMKRHGADRKVPGGSAVRRGK